MEKGKVRAKKGEEESGWGKMYQWEKEKELNVVKIKEGGSANANISSPDGTCQLFARSRVRREKTKHTDPSRGKNGNAENVVAFKESSNGRKRPEIKFWQKAGQGMKGLGRKFLLKKADCKSSAVGGSTST